MISPTIPCLLIRLESLMAETNYRGLFMPTLLEDLFSAVGKLNLQDWVCTKCLSDAELFNVCTLVVPHVNNQRPKALYVNSYK
jgi:hypothetical protein